ncbi:MAG: TIM barrel protein [Lachnospiraceae bacterium]|nr:TIM barrel protein [Lachnospiraceae bacterium]
MKKTAIKFLLKSELFGLTWDIGHSNSANNIDEKFILENENKLYHFHIHDSLQKQDHMTLGTGEIDLKQRLGIAAKRNCRCVIETKTVAALKESVFWLARLSSP